jgi:hypothetical protein
VSTSVLLPTVYVEIVNAAVAASVGFPECHATAGRRSRREHNTKAGVASCIVVYHNCATSIASLRIQSPLSLESLRSGIDRRNDAMISLTQCMILGGLGPNETILGVAPCAKHHSLLLSYLFNLKRGLAFVRDMIIADLRSSIDIERWRLNSSFRRHGQQMSFRGAPLLNVKLVFAQLGLAHFRALGLGSLHNCQEIIAVARCGEMRDVPLLERLSREMARKHA